jgi:hypothetical protein
LMLDEVLPRDARLFPRLVTRKTRSALVSREARDCPLRRIAAIHEEVLVALERRDERIEGIDFRLEFRHLFPCEVALFEKDATEGG